MSGWWHFINSYTKYDTIWLYNIPQQKINPCIFGFEENQIFYKKCYHIYQPLRSGRIWHKVNF